MCRNVQKFHATKAGDVTFLFFFGYLLQFLFDFRWYITSRHIKLPHELFRSDCTAKICQLSSNILLPWRILVGGIGAMVIFRGWMFFFIMRRNAGIPEQYDLFFSQFPRSLNKTYVSLD